MDTWFSHKKCTIFHSLALTSMCSASMATFVLGQNFLSLSERSTEETEATAPSFPRVSQADALRQRAFNVYRIDIKI